MNGYILLLTSKYIKNMRWMHFLRIKDVRWQVLSKYKGHKVAWHVEASYPFD